MKIYVYDDKETANKVARTIFQMFGVNVEQRGTALKIAEELYNKAVYQSYAPHAAWTARHLS